MSYVTDVQRGSGMAYLEFQNYIYRTIVGKSSIVKIIYYCVYKGMSGTITVIYDYIT